LTLVGFDVTATTSYGTVSAGDNTSSTNQVVAVKNAGNNTSTLRVNGTAMTLAGVGSISTSSQHYATSTFTYGGAEQALSGSATDVAGFLISRPPLTNWATTTAYPVNVHTGVGVAHDGYLYYAGGCTALDACATLTSTVRFAALNANGTAGAWTNTTAYPNVITSLGTGASAWGDYLYIVGGCLAYTGGNCTTATTTVRYALVSATGSVGAWSSTTALPTSRLSNALAYNGYLYQVAGCTLDCTVATNLTSSVLFAPIQSDGSLGSWSSTTPLPDALGAVGVGAMNGYLYVIGGCTNIDLAGCDAASLTSTVRYAPINATGSVGSWTTTSPLATSTYYINGRGTIADSGLFYSNMGSLGADGIATLTSTTWFSIQERSGRASTWGYSGVKVLTPVTSPVVTAYNGYGYIIGGTVDASTITSTVRYIPLASRNTYWGVAVPAGTPTGTYSGVNTFTAVWSQ
jgi:hypothetical protein